MFILRLSLHTLSSSFEGLSLHILTMESASPDPDDLPSFDLTDEELTNEIYYELLTTVTQSNERGMYSTSKWYSYTPHAIILQGRGSIE